MTARGFRARLVETALGIGAAIVAVGLAGAALVIGPAPAIAAAIGIAIVLGIVEDPRIGAFAVTAFVILQIPEVAADFHGAPPTFAPLLALVILSVLARAIRTGEPLRGAGRAIVVTACFLGAALLSLLPSPVAGDGLRAVIGLASDAAVAVVIALLVRTTTSLRMVIWTLLGGGLFLGGLSLLQFVTDSFGSAFGGFARSEVHQIYDTLDDVRVSGPLEDANFYAQWMVMLVPLAIDRFHDESSGIARLAALASLLVSVGVVIITFSRGGLLALGVVLAIMAVRHPPRIRTVAAVAILGVLSLPLLPEGYTDRLLALADIGAGEAAEDASLRSREAEARVGLAIFTDHPVTGAGYGQFIEGYQEYVRTLGIEQAAKPREAHNLYLETAAEMGLVGLAVLTGAIGLVATSLVEGRRRFRLAGDHQADGIGYAIAASLVGYLVTSIFLHMAYSRPVWLLVGLALTLPSIAAKTNHRLADAVAA